jgi:hypothetical protein
VALKPPLPGRGKGEEREGEGVSFRKRETFWGIVGRWRMWSKQEIALGGVYCDEKGGGRWTRF